MKTEKARPNKRRCGAINNTIVDISRLNKSMDGSKTYDKDPNCTLNDYTKNISESIFSPGNHTKVKGIKIANPYYKKGPGKAIYSNVKGMTGTVSGTIGDKRLSMSMAAKKPAI